MKAQFLVKMMMSRGPTPDGTRETRRANRQQLDLDSVLNEIQVSTPLFLADEGA